MQTAVAAPLFSPHPPGPAGIVSWAHIGDLHLTAAGEPNHRDLLRIADHLNAAFCDSLSFVFLPGDNADNGSAEAYAAAREALDRLALPWCAIVGDHDVHERSHGNFLATLSPALHYTFIVGSFRFLALNAFDIPEPPSFAMLPPQLAWARREMTEAQAAGQRTILLLHCYPGDLKQGRAELRALIGEYRPLLIDMGHTHYNEIANDGHTLYAATRSTGQIEEGPVGFSITALDGPAVSWRFFPLGQDPCVLITSPADARLSTGLLAHGSVRAKVWSADPIAAVTVSIDGASTLPMQRIASSNVWQCERSANRTVSVTARTATGNGASDSIEVVRDPQRANPASDHEDRFTIGAWPEHGLLGTQLGPNKNGKKW